MNTHSILVITALLLVLSLGSGCSRKDDPKVATQVAARVNSDEITVHQVNNALAQTKDVEPRTASQAKRAVLETLINRQLASQKAIEAQLDRSPMVVQAIEAAKTEVLARAYLEGIARTLSTPAPWAIRDYYAKHPELFAQRRIYALEQVIFAADASLSAELTKQLSRSRSLKEVTDWLQSRDVKLTINQGVRAAEQLPLDILPKVVAMKQGEIELFDMGGGRFQLIRVVDSMAAPMDEATAAPYIEQFLYNRTLSEAIAQEMSQIRKQAKIEYMGEFADDSTGSGAKGKPEGSAGTPGKAEANAEVQAILPNTR